MLWHYNITFVAFHSPTIAIYDIFFAGNWFFHPVSGKNCLLGIMGSLSNHSIHLMTPTKVLKISCVHLVTHLMTSIIYYYKSGLNYDHELRNICNKLNYMYSVYYMDKTKS